MPILRHCATQGCTRLVLKGRCPQHKAADAQRRNARVKAYGYSSTNWQRIRQLRYAIANGICELKLPGCTSLATHTHLDPAAHGDHRSATIYQARACCANCSGAIDAPRSNRRGAVVDREPSDTFASRANSRRNTLVRRLAG